jgi:dTDP-glucose 4,6-dehydratase
MVYERNILVSGGAGFIGSHLVRLLVNKYPNYRIVNLDKLTYAGNLSNLKDIADKPNYVFIKGDICDRELLDSIYTEYGIDGVFHCAAESHVDRSIEDPLVFIRTNVEGTASMLLAAKKHWNGRESGKMFLHISTDEVYGSLGESGYFTEETSYDPRSPYSASKAGSDHLVKAFGHTYGLPVVISNCSNNYGPYQFPEKLIPLMIRNIMLQKPLPVYGKGENIRDWIYVEDHVRALDLVFHRGRSLETYNIGGGNEWRNIDLVETLCDLMDERTGKAAGASRSLISFVKDRAGHDFRYAIDSGKIDQELGWKPELDFREGLRKSIDWYLEHQDWLEEVSSGAYLEYYEKQYER